MLQSRKIRVVPFNKKWHKMFRHEAILLRRLLPQEIIHVHHIGSTSIPNMKAKPIIDILLVVKDVNILDAFDNKMNQAGFKPMGENGIKDRRFYIKGDRVTTCHVHAFNEYSYHVRRHVAFRDYMIAHPFAAKEYATLKSKCAKSCKRDINGYCECKEGFIIRHEAKALHWWKTHHHHY